MVEALHCTSHDNECARRLNTSLCHENGDKCTERDALQSHVAVLTSQNGQLSNELTAFVHQDECLREQLNRRSRWHALDNKNKEEISASNNRVQEARSKSPIKPAFLSSPVRHIIHSSPIRNV